MISEFELRSALDDYLQAAATAEGLEVRWPGLAPVEAAGVTSTPLVPVNGQTGWVGRTTWLEPSILTRSNRTLSLGSSGYEEDAGTYQIAIVCQKSYGGYELDKVVDKLRPYYRGRSGTVLQPSGWKLNLYRADPRPVFEANGSLRLPFLVPFSVYAPG